MVGFRTPKGGNDIGDWEDFFAYAAADGSARAVVLDGAAEGFDAQRWVSQLAGDFLTLDDAVIATSDVEAFFAWIEGMQQRWDEETPAALNPFEEIKLREQGSLATLVGCVLVGLDGPRPSWEAIALGDAVLFHVRAGRVLATFPNLMPVDFGINPIGVFTMPRMLPRMREALRTGGGALHVGDALYLASDALAEFLVGCRPAEPWEFLADLDDQEVFAHFVRGLRSAGQLKNDDVTLVRVEITDGDPEFFVVGR